MKSRVYPQHTRASAGFAHRQLLHRKRGDPVYSRSGQAEVVVPRGRVFPDKGSVVDEMVLTLKTGRAPPHDGAWGAATMEVCEAVLESAHTSQEVFLSR